MRVVQIGDRRTQLVRVNQGLKGPSGISGSLILAAFTLPANGLTTASVTVTSGVINDGDSLFGTLQGVTVIVTKSAGTVTARRYLPGAATIAIPAGAAFIVTNPPLDILPLSANATIPTSGFVDLPLILPDLYVVTGQTHETTIKGVPCTVVKQATAQTWRCTPSRYPSSPVSVFAAIDYFVVVAGAATIQTNPLAIGGNALSDGDLSFIAEGGVRSAAFALWDAVSQKAAFIVDTLGTAYFSRVHSLPFAGGLIDSSETIYPTGGNYLFKICDPNKNVIFGVTDSPSITIGRSVIGAGGEEPGGEEPGGEEPAPTVAAWNELNGFWQGYAPLSPTTTSTQGFFDGSTTNAVADDYSTRKSFLAQKAGAAVRAYFAHYSDHIPGIFPGTFPSGLTQFLSWGIGHSVGNSTAAGAAVDFKRGTIQGRSRPQVPADFEGWSDPIAIDVAVGEVLQLGAAQNIQGRYRIGAPHAMTGQTAVGSASGGWLTNVNTRWSNASSPPLIVANGDVDSIAGIRFLAVKTPVDQMIVIVGDSISRGIVFTTLAASNPLPVHWPGLYQQSLTARQAVWLQGAGGGALVTMITNQRWLDRIIHATHMIVALGTNDFIQGVSAATHQSNVEALARIATQAGQKTYLSTIIPSDLIVGNGNDSARIAFNNWVRTNPLGNGFIDFDLAVRNPNAQSQILPIYDTDGTHPNNAGHAAMFAAITITL
ncbi:MAG: GDSL-type esterase/lipase family protein [Thermosynechococcaceae cyanobacterium MS004]|nr:GDSL-type esterase/lipase family protein [Thermosynechococcaceae cyanobacterium MS004]